MPENPQFYDASAAASAPPTRVDSLKRLQARDAEQRMLSFLDELDEWIAQSRDHDREQGMDPAIAALLDAIAGADDAPLEFRSLHRRVHDRTLTWAQVWDAPEEEPGGMRLVNVAMKAAGAELGASMQALEEDEREQPQTPYPRPR